MMVLKVNDTEYKVKFGYNSFCDTDLLDRVTDLSILFNEGGVTSDDDVSSIGKIKELFCVVRELLFYGFKKYNPVESVQEIGDILDDYNDEKVEGEDRGLLSLFLCLSDELMNEGFLGDVVKKIEEATKKSMKNPTDHKLPQKK